MEHLEEGLENFPLGPVKVVATNCGTVNINVHLSSDLLNQDFFEQLISQIVKKQIDEKQNIQKKLNKKKQKENNQ